MADNQPKIGQTVYADYWRRHPLKVVRIEDDKVITVPLDTDVCMIPMKYCFDGHGEPLA